MPLCFKICSMKYLKIKNILQNNTYYNSISDREYGKFSCFKSMTISDTEWYFYFSEGKGLFCHSVLLSPDICHTEIFF